MFSPVQLISIILYSLTIYLFIFYLNIMHFWYAYNDWIFHNVENKSVYDYIIVGGGSAGSVIAAKLSNTKKKVLLLEAGGPSPYLIDIPILTPLLQKSKYDWQYVTEPQKDSCKGLIDKKSIWPMGKILGGSGRLNYMVYVRGHPTDYDWLSHFYEPIIENRGSLNVETVKWSSVLSDGVMKGIMEMSQPVHNINKGTKTGFMKVHLTMKDGKRWSTDNILHRSDSLTVLTNAFVHRILFNSKKAIGVEFTIMNETIHIFAKNSVIVSAGAIGTPKLLMLSGVGPKQHLEKFKINVVADLPVGQNLVDHISTGLDLVTLKINPLISIIDVLNPLSMFNYFLFGKGPWTFSGVEVIGTFHKTFPGNQSVSPDLQIMVLSSGISQDSGIVFQKTLGISDKVFQQYFAPLTHTTTISIVPILLHPKSSGQVKLRSTDPNDNPIIDPKYLSDRDDVLTLINGIKFIKQLVKTKAMKDLGAAIYQKHFPGCEDKIFDTEDYWECYIRHLTLTTYHPAGTCQMGHVTDKSFRVLNTENLHVVDASVFPVLPSGNINAAVVMLAEQASRLILQNGIQSTVRKRITTCHIIDIFFKKTNSFYI